jgi:two-component system sensor histidine kinase/response regulator
MPQLLRQLMRGFANLPCSKFWSLYMPFGGFCSGLATGESLIIFILIGVIWFRQGRFEAVQQRCHQLVRRCQTLRQRLSQQVALTQLMECLQPPSEIEITLGQVVKKLQCGLNCDRALIYRLDSTWSTRIIAEAVSPEQPAWQALPDYQSLGVWHKGQLLLAQVKQGKPTGCYLNDVAQQSNPDYYRPLTRQAMIHAYAALPLRCGNQLWGVLVCYDHHHPRQWSPAQKSLLNQAGQYLSKAIQNHQLLAQLQAQIQALATAKEQEATANQAKSEFLSYMSHELRTPLNAILGFTQILQREATPYLPAEQQQSVDIIGRSGEHLLSLINDILDMSKIEAGQMPLTEHGFNLHQLLETLKDMLCLRATSKGLALNFEYLENTPPHIYADEQKLRQILVNLLGNAIKFTQKGQVTCRVWAEFLDADSSAQPSETPIQLFISVEDTGPGIDADELDHLFEAFQQTRSATHTSEGTGLGLTISRRFAQMMGGKIGVVSEPNRGSTFTVRIPCLSVKPKRLVQPPPAKRLPTVSQHPYRMLVTDDDATSRLLLTKFLSSMGFEIRQACNGQEAVQIWQQWQPDLIWMDIRMPLMDGCEATQHIRALDPAKETVIIALTASAFEEQRQMMLTSGCQDFVRKPFKREELLDKIRQHLDEKWADTTGVDRYPRPIRELEQLQTA